MNEQLWNQILNKVKEIINQWYEEGLSDYDKYFSIPSQTVLYSKVEEEVKKEMERIMLNVLNGKDSRINGKKIMENIKNYFIEKSKENHKEFIIKHGNIDWNNQKRKGDI